MDSGMRSQHLGAPFLKACRKVKAFVDVNAPAANRPESPGDFQHNAIFTTVEKLSTTSATGNLRLSLVAAQVNALTRRQK